ncbi:hypothetical protein INT43_005071 [Umbelopsis isabellina]|uniref:Uncharacterized protein n=1 Tax=Mortierella isabellina TaxID=91625 RepID=A0A8H7PGY7_MORIS|nr:hypothetical protein INT43_005071 [Umbelopsis isabellina]
MESDEEESEYQLDESSEEEELGEQLEIPSDEDSDGSMNHLQGYPDESEETSEKELKKSKAPKEVTFYTKLSAQTAQGGAYRRYFIHREHMISKAAKMRAEIIREHQLQGPSEELLRSIYMLTAHRCFEVENVPDQDLFRQSALFAMGVLVEEMAKHAANKEVDMESHEQDNSMAGDNHDKDTRNSRKRKTGSKTRRT